MTMFTKLNHENLSNNSQKKWLYKIYIIWLKINSYNSIEIKEANYLIVKIVIYNKNSEFVISVMQKYTPKESRITLIEILYMIASVWLTTIWIVFCVHLSNKF